ncbi:MAG: M24 family metallopeptidase [Holosporaceae bacterium]|nr:M24 family metallopeptidase [Holosporaceae bacterium]
MDSRFLPKNVDAILYKKNSERPGLSDESQDIFQLMAGIESSDGAVIISRKKSAIFVDGRYTLAAKQQANLDKFEILNLRNDEIIKWAKENLPRNSQIALDYRYYTHDEIAIFTNNWKNFKFVNIDLERTLKIPPQQFDFEIYRLNNSGGKLLWVMEVIEKNNLNAYLLCDPCSIAWLLDIRDLNRKYTPVVACNLLVTKDSRKFLYLDNRYRFCNQFKFENDLKKDLLKYSRIGIDRSQTSYHIKHRNFVDLKNPCILPKSLKSKVEIDHMKLACIEDSVAIINFLYWFHNNTEKITELTVVEKILYFRKQREGFVGESFKTIAAADEHSAMVHYYPNVNSNKTIDNILLIDSGGQYKHGTTDITRTLSRFDPTEEQKFFYTLVLKGHIALATAKFPSGTKGAQLDSLARRFLWQHSKDYSHSTGHGIGYMSHVHEGPIAISKSNNVPLQSGMILSNEPGYYQENSFGIRLENMMLVAEKSGSMFFEVISLIPFDSKFIDKNLLTEEDMYWLQRYNRSIISTLKLQASVLNWLSDSYLKDFL